MTLGSHDLIDQLLFLVFWVAHHRLLLRAHFLRVFLRAPVEIFNPEDVDLHGLVTLLSLLNRLVLADQITVEEYL